MRWGQKYDTYLQSFKSAVENAIPVQVGIWTADPNEDQIGIDNELIRRVAGAEGSLARRYRGSYDIPDVHINITCGFSRSVGAHTPDVCFTGSGSEQKTDVEIFEVYYPVTILNPENPEESVKDEHVAKFKTAIFSDSAGHYEQRVFWGWKGLKTDWVAPRFPRLKWNSSEPICKMYVSIIEGGKTLEGQTDTQKVAEEFLKSFLPELDRLLTGEYVLPESLQTIAQNREIEKKSQLENSINSDANAMASTPADNSNPKSKQKSNQQDSLTLDAPTESEKSSQKHDDNAQDSSQKANAETKDEKKAVDEFDLDL